MNEVFVVLIGAGVTVVAAIIGVSAQLYLVRQNRAYLAAQTRNINEQTETEGGEQANLYAQATQGYAEELVRVRAEFKQFRDAQDVLDRERREQNEKRETALQNELKAAHRINAEMSEKLDDVQDWANRLFHQVKSLGGEPVPFKPVKPKVEGA